MPALAQTKPCFVSVMITPRSASILTMERLSRSTSSTSLGSFPVSCASRQAKPEGSTSRRSTSRPSALDTTFCVTTMTSPDSTGVPWRSAAVTDISPRRSPAATSGMPATPMTSIRGAAQPSVFMTTAL